MTPKNGSAGKREDWRRARAIVEKSLVENREKKIPGLRAGEEVRAVCIQARCWFRNLLDQSPTDVVPLGRSRGGWRRSQNHTISPDRRALRFLFAAADVGFSTWFVFGRMLTGMAVGGSGSLLVL
jgi:hypothetical protein